MHKICQILVFFIFDHKIMASIKFITTVQRWMRSQEDFGCENCFPIWTFCDLQDMILRPVWIVFFTHSDYGFSDHIVTHPAKMNGEHRELFWQSHFLFQSNDRSETCLVSGAIISNTIHNWCFLLLRGGCRKCIALSMWKSRNVVVCLD